MKLANASVPLKRILIEFLVLFSAVTLSFLAEDLREYLGDRRDEIELLERLVLDLEADAHFIRVAALPIDRRAEVAGVWLQENWSRRNLPVDSLDWAAHGLLRGITFAPSRTEYEAAKSSGRLELIQNRELLRQISTHYEQTHAVMEDVTTLNLDAHLEWVESIRPYVNYASTFSHSVDLRLDPANTTLGDEWPTTSISDNWSAMQNNNSMRAMLVETNTLRRLTVAWQEVNLAETTALLEALEAELIERR